MKCEKSRVQTAFWHSQTHDLTINRCLINTSMQYTFRNHPPAYRALETRFLGNWWRSPDILRVVWEDRRRFSSLRRSISIWNRRRSRWLWRRRPKEREWRRPASRKWSPRSCPDQPNWETGWARCSCLEKDGRSYRMRITRVNTTAHKLKIISR